MTQSTDQVTMEPTVEQSNDDQSNKNHPTMKDIMFGLLSHIKSLQNKVTLEDSAIETTSDHDIDDSDHDSDHDSEWLNSLAYTTLYLDDEHKSSIEIHREYEKKMLKSCTIFIPNTSDGQKRQKIKKIEYQVQPKNSWELYASDLKQDIEFMKNIRKNVIRNIGKKIDVMSEDMIDDSCKAHFIDVAHKLWYEMKDTSPETWNEYQTRALKLKEESKLPRVRSISFYKNDLLHRDDGPAYIYYDDDGQIIYEEYYQNGKYHRSDDKPAIIVYFETGSIHSVKYLQKGKLHRTDDKPAMIVYSKSGNIVTEKYYRYHKLHRVLSIVC